MLKLSLEFLHQTARFVCDLHSASVETPGRLLGLRNCVHDRPLLRGSRLLRPNLKLVERNPTSVHSPITNALMTERCSTIFVARRHCRLPVLEDRERRRRHTGKQRSQGSRYAWPREDGIGPRTDIDPKAHW